MICELQPKQVRSRTFRDLFRMFFSSAILCNFERVPAYTPFYLGLILSVVQLGFS